jgi:4-hydroxy-tetrahydrodipicolinate synthase
MGTGAGGRGDGGGRTGEPRNGVIASIATPFAADGFLDRASLRKYVSYCIACGVTGILTPAFAGEVNELTESERLAVVETVLDETGGRVPVIGCATAVSQERRLEGARSLLAAGCDAILVHVPNEPAVDMRGNVMAVADLQPKLLMLQDADNQGPGLPVDLIARLHSEIASFRWIKVEVANRCRKFPQIREAAGQGLRIGTAGLQMIEALDRGVDAYMPTIMLDVYDAVFRLHGAGRRGEAVALFERLLPIIMFPYSHAPLPFNKRLLVRLGLFATDAVRRAGESLDVVEDRLADELVERAVQLTRSLGRVAPGL